jgi:AraC family transcriptional regulator
MITVEVPEATYAVFTSPPVDFTEDSSLFTDEIKETWKYIFENWFRDSEYELDLTKYDFEFNDERRHEQTGIVMDIYVPVIKK